MLTRNMPALPLITLFWMVLGTGSFASESSLTLAAIRAKERPSRSTMENLVGRSYESTMKLVGIRRVRGGPTPRVDLVFRREIETAETKVKVEIRARVDASEVIGISTKEMIKISGKLVTPWGHDTHISGGKYIQFTLRGLSFPDLEKTLKSLMKTAKHQEKLMGVPVRAFESEPAQEAMDAYLEAALRLYMQLGRQVNARMVQLKQDGDDERAEELQKAYKSLNIHAIKGKAARDLFYKFQEELLEQRDALVVNLKRAHRKTHDSGEKEKINAMIETVRTLDKSLIKTEPPDGN